MGFSKKVLLKSFTAILLSSMVLGIMYHYMYTQEDNNNTLHTKFRDTRYNVQVKKEEIPSLDDLANDDPRLIEIIKKHWIDPPSKESYNFSKPSLVKAAMFKQDTFVDGLLKHMEHGFFIEAGAVDGEVVSNSLFFEVRRKWTGLLVEPDPHAYGLLKTKHRNAYTVNSCLDTTTSKATFDVMWRKGHIERGNKTKKTLVHNNPGYKTTIQCFSLYSLLLAINQTRIDFFSLDVESSEPQVLKAIPFDKIDIRVICVEYTHCGEKILHDILEPHGFKMLKKMGYDIIFMKS